MVQQNVYLMKQVTLDNVDFYIVWTQKKNVQMLKSVIITMAMIEHKNI